VKNGLQSFELSAKARRTQKRTLNVLFHQLTKRIHNGLMAITCDKVGVLAKKGFYQIWCGVFRDVRFFLVDSLPFLEAN
jgi:hypothetical protein